MASFRIYLLRNTRALVPLLLIQLGRDDEAYNFIKFWLKNTPKEQDYMTGEDGLFPDLPFKEHTMKDQDKNVDCTQREPRESSPWLVVFYWRTCVLFWLLRS